tara:strand:+ start:2016 stop:5180 length:3165 start_codon:yes stop_codon:yes gene_type:complete
MMEQTIGWIVVSLVAAVLVWQASTHLGTKKRTGSSIIRSLAMDDIDVDGGVIGPRGGETSSFIVPRVDYEQDMVPFQTEVQSEANQDEAEKEQVIDQIERLKGAAMERHSIRERSVEKILECNSLIEMIRGVGEKHITETEQELLSLSVDGLTLVELDDRHAILLKIYNRLYQLSFEDEIQRVRRREMEAMSEKELQEMQEADKQIGELSSELEILRREEQLYREIQAAQTTTYLENLDMSGLSEEAEERLQSHYDFYYSRLKEIERQRGEVEKFEQWSNLILDCEDQDELKAMVFTGVNTKMKAELEERREKRMSVLELRVKHLKEEARTEELRLLIDSAKSSKELDSITIDGVNPIQEKELVEMFTIARENLVYAELRVEILDCEYVLELDAMQIEGVNEVQREELLELRMKCRNELIELAKQKKFEEQYNRYLGLLSGIDDIDELLDIGLENVNAEQRQELENIRLERLDYLEELERQRIEREQAARFEELRKEIEGAKTSAEVEAVVIDGVNEDQQEELERIQAQVLEILLEDEQVNEYVEKAIKKVKKEPVDVDFNIEAESKFRTRVKTLQAADGALRFSLIWDNMNDLDLIIKTPAGDVVHRGKRRSSCGGKLDLEMNAKPQMKAAMENVVWPAGKAPPAGKYYACIWHRNRHRGMRKSDPTDYTLRVKMGADYYLYNGQASYGDKLEVIAIIDVPDASTLRTRMEEEARLYKQLREQMKIAKKPSEMPEIDANLSSLHQIMLKRNIEKAVELLKEKARKRALAKQKAEYEKIMRVIENSRSLDELSAVRYAHLNDDVVNVIDKAVAKRKKQIESGLKRAELQAEREKIQNYKTKISNAKSLTELSSIVFKDIDKRHADTLQRMRIARRKVLQKELDPEEVEKDKQMRLHKALNGAYKRGGLQPLPQDEWKNDLFDERLSESGAKGGDVQISLLWENKNDFNILVVTPTQEIIHPRNPKSSDGGVQDVEMNQKGESKTPVENVYWGDGKAPKGTYYVYVHFYKEHQKFRKVDISDCRIRILAKGAHSEYEAQMSLANQLQFVTKFKVE